MSEDFSTEIRKIEKSVRLIEKNLYLIVISGKKNLLKREIKEDEVRENIRRNWSIIEEKLELLDSLKKRCEEIISCNISLANRDRCEHLIEKIDHIIEILRENKVMVKTPYDRIKKHLLK